MAEVGPDTKADSPEQLRDALVDRLRARGAVRSPQVEAAMRTVPRHLFIPEVSVADAYADTQVVTKTDAAGKALSSVSHPGVVAGMLEQLDVHPGHRVLEIGSGGYNAALLAHLVGSRGQVTTLDIDPDVTARAQQRLAAAGCDQVRVITRDGEHGHPEGAPYDRITVTAGAWDLPPAWFDQLAADGRLVVPLRLRALSRIITFAQDEGIWRSRAIEFAGFVPIRGDGAHTAQVIPLTHEGDVVIHTDDQADGTLEHALDHPATVAWTGVIMPHGTTYEHLDLWLAGIPGFCRLTATPDAIARGVVTPTFSWGGSAVHHGGAFAHLTERASAPETDAAGKRRGTAEIGVRAHGPDSARLAEAVAERIRVFDREHRAHHRAVIEVRPHDDGIAPQCDALITKRHVRLLLSWK
jgi:protein-L-isoaspartate(D-aspartate) O-methyltransferase